MRHALNGWGRPAASRNVQDDTETQKDAAR